ncbi:ABC transporter permease [Streptomyces sp. NPDC015032]|uniref:ABC transporter permease n=1 Tax=Streptomyces sp. NPDC015032 TaxID=3364937 RepID=UPI0037005CC9
MNFVKRAGLSLIARTGKSALLLGIFLVVCTLLLGGFMLQGAVARQEAGAQRKIGVDVTVRGDKLTADAAAKLGASPLVERYNLVLGGTSRAPGLKLLQPDAPRPPESRSQDDGPGLTGLCESEMLLDFATGHTKLVDGRPITARDADHKVVLIDKQLAEKNGLKVGDKIKLTSPDGKGQASYDVVGIFQAPREGGGGLWRKPAELPANQIYAPLAALAPLSMGDKLGEAVFKLSSPEKARVLHAEAKRQLGGDGFRFDVNDKAFREQVQPLRKVGAFAGVFVWLIAGAGTVILGLIVTLTIRERRDELGMLLSLGEKKWKLIGQHTVEVAAVAVPAVAVAALAGAAFGPDAGAKVLTAPDTAAQPGPPTAQLPPPEMRMQSGDLGKVAGLGLGISLVSTVIPGIGILRLHPRSILTDSE